MLDESGSTEHVEAADLERGLRFLLYDGICSQVLVILSTGAFLVAFALQLGASNRTIGLIAAIGPLSQMLQIPAIYLTNRVQRRRFLTVSGAVLSRLCWFVFGIAFLIGVYSIHRLLAVREEGEAAEQISVEQLFAEVRKLTQNISTVPSIRQLTHFPYAILQYRTDREPPP